MYQATYTHMCVCRAGCLLARSFALFLVCRERPLVHSRWLKVRAKCCTMAPTDLESRTPIHTYIFNATIIDPLMDVLRSLWLHRKKTHSARAGVKNWPNTWQSHRRLGTNCSQCGDDLSPVALLEAPSVKAVGEKLRHSMRSEIEPQQRTIDWPFFSFSYLLKNSIKSWSILFSFMI